MYRAPSCQPGAPAGLQTKAPIGRHGEGCQSATGLQRDLIHPRDFDLAAAEEEQRAGARRQ